jgi:hypothetical protein
MLERHKTTMMVCLALRDFVTSGNIFRMHRAALGENKFRAICRVLVAAQQLRIDRGAQQNRRSSVGNLFL